MAFESSRSRPASQLSASPSAGHFAGVLQQKNGKGEILTSKRIYADSELTIGRDKSRCQYVIDEPVVSNKHVRIYPVVFERDNPTEIPPLVYAEDLSRNGTYWNGSLIGKGNGGFLLSDGDTLRVSAHTYFTFQRWPVGVDPTTFDLTQEREMEHFKREYIITDRLLGSGAFGKVFMAINRSSRTQLACKVVDLRKLKPQPRARFGRLEQPAAAKDVDSRVQLRKVRDWVDRQKGDNCLEEKLKIYYREAEILARINHPNIISLEKVYVTDNTMYMFQDLVTAGDLFSYLEHKNGKLLEVEAAVIVRQVLIALEFLHNKNIVHRDLKPENVLMTSLAAGSRVVLTDFGASRFVSNRIERMSTLIGTVGYTAPEVLSHQILPAGKKGYTRAVDMWSLGCLTVLLLTGGLAFIDPKTDEYSEKLAGECNFASLERCPEWQQVRTRPKDFVKKLLVTHELARLSAREALNHEWFSNELHKTNFEDLYRRTTRHWRPRALKQPVIEFVDADRIRRLACSRIIIEATGKKPRQRYQLPIEPPYIPFPRNMHQPFFPKRPTGNRLMSEEVRTAIQEKWTFKDNSESSFESGEEPVLPVTPSYSGTARDSLVPNLEKSVEPIRPVPKRNKTFKPLHPRTPSTMFGMENAAWVEGVSNYVVESVEQADSSHGNLHASMTFSPSAWLEDQSPGPSEGTKTTCTEDRATARSPPDLGSSKTMPIRSLVKCSPDPIIDSKGDSPLVSWTIAHEMPAERANLPNQEFLHSLSNFEEKSQSVAPQSQGATQVKANPNLESRSQSLCQQSLSNMPNTKKRRWHSVFDIETDGAEGDEDNTASKREPRRLRAGWKPASEAALEKERHKILSNGCQAGDLSPSTILTGKGYTLLTATDSPPYLPRL